MIYSNSWQAARFIDRVLNETGVFQRLVGAVAKEFEPKAASSFEMINGPFGRGLSATGMPSLRLFGPATGTVALIPPELTNMPNEFYDILMFALKANGLEPFVPLCLL